MKKQHLIFLVMWIASVYIIGLIGYYHKEISEIIWPDPDIIMLEPGRTYLVDGKVEYFGDTSDYSNPDTVMMNILPEGCVDSVNKQ